MTDLDERHDHDEWIEQRARRAGADLRAVAERRAITPLHPGPTSVPVRRYGRPLLLAFVAAAVVIGLVLVVGRPTTRPVVDNRRPEDLRFLVDGVPAGWRLAATKDQGVGAVPERSGRDALVFGTPGDLAAPAMQLSWLSSDADATVGEIPGPHDVGPEFVDLGVEGVDATCMAPISGGYECLLATAVGNMELDARNMSLEQIRTVVAGLRIAFGVVSVDPGAMPAGMVEFERGRQGMDPSYLADERSYSRTAYAPTDAADNTQNIQLYVAWDDGLDVASLAGIGPWEPTTVNGLPAFTYHFDFGLGTHSVFWTDGTRRFLLTAHGVDVDIVRLAESVRPAGADEWPSNG